jgi:hypothetical protein
MEETDIQPQAGQIWKYQMKVTAHDGRVYMTPPYYYLLLKEIESVGRTYLTIDLKSGQNTVIMLDRKGVYEMYDP